MKLKLLTDTQAICKLPAQNPIPQWAQGEFVSMTRTEEELSIVCSQQFVPDAIQAQRDWRCIQVVGPLEFTLVGILAQLTAILAKAKISVFAISSYDTDFLLVRAANLAKALDVLHAAGHEVESS